MPSWTAKDPDAVKDYLYTIALDAGDSVASYTFTKLSGDVAIDSHSRDGADVTAWLRGGTEGETAVFRVSWVTAAGREDDDVITLAIVANEYEALALTGYVKPGVNHLLARYPAFTTAERSTIRYWLTDAERHVDESWTEGDYAAGLMALAAHNMAAAGIGADALVASLPAGLTKFKSGSLDVSFSDEAANGRATGALGSTRYGAEYLALLRRNRGGPRVMATGVAPYDPFRYPHGEA